MVALRQRQDAPPRSVLVKPFDITMYSDERGEGVMALQSRYSSWLRGLPGPARFICWQVPADLTDKIHEVTFRAKGETEALRRKMLAGYRRFYQELNETADFQTSICGITIWTDEKERAVAGSVASTFDTQVAIADFPKLFDGKYKLAEHPFWHLAPAGRADGRPFIAVLTSYEILPSTWNFYKPLPPLLKLNFPMAVCVDIPETFERNAATEKIENMIQAYSVHLATATTEDSRSVRRVQDCYRTLQEINNGEALHRVNIVIAVAAHDLRTLQERVQEIITQTRGWFLLRQEVGELLARSVGYFSVKRTTELGMPDTSYPATSHEAALLFSPLGYQKLGQQEGVLRGVAATGNYPVFFKSLGADKKAAHEIWVGLTGSGKTFTLNCHLTRSYVEEGIPFDLLEPMGHGKLIAQALGFEPYSLSAKRSVLNPQDVLYPTLAEQISHTIGLYEAILKRPLSGQAGQEGNIQRSLLAQALDQAYKPWVNQWQKLTPDYSPTCEDICDLVSGLGHTPRIKGIAQDFADELSGLLTGSGPFATFLNGHTTFDFGRTRADNPRVFSFNELEGDDVMVAIAYVQTLAALRRDALMDDRPRIIAIDEVYRLMRYPALQDFMIEGTKTFRTRRKALILIDQQMRIFTHDEKARLIFENCSIRAIMSQKQGISVFMEDAAFRHLNAQHIQMIRDLKRGEMVLDIQDVGTWFLQCIPTEFEKKIYGVS